MSAIQIELTIELDLEADAVWPDGDAPDDVTAEAIVAVVEKSGTLARFLDDWNAAGCGAEVAVHAGGRMARGWLP